MPLLAQNKELYCLYRTPTIATWDPDLVISRKAVQKEEKKKKGELFLELNNSTSILHLPVKTHYILYAYIVF